MMWYIYIQRDITQPQKGMELGHLQSFIQSEVSQKEKNKYMLMNIYGIQKNGTSEPICRAGIETQMQRQTCGHRRGRGGGPGLERGTGTRTLACVKQTASGMLSQHREVRLVSVTTQRGGREAQEREDRRVCIQLTQDVVQQKPTQHCKANMSQLFKTVLKTRYNQMGSLLTLVRMYLK